MHKREHFDLKRCVFIYSCYYSVKFWKSSIKAQIYTVTHKREYKIVKENMIMMLRETLDYDRWISEDDIPILDVNLIANLNGLQIAALKYKDIPTFLNYTDSFRDQTRNAILACRR